MSETKNPEAHVPIDAETRDKTLQGKMGSDSNNWDDGTPCVDKRLN